MLTNDPLIAQYHWW